MVTTASSRGAPAAAQPTGLPPTGAQPTGPRPAGLAARPAGSARRRAYRRAVARWLPTPTAIAGLVIVLVVVLTALAADLLVPTDPNQQSLLARLQAPAVQGAQSAQGGSFLLGTDHLGRDILARIVYGSRISLVIGVAAVVLSGSVGVLLGLLAGYLGGWWDTVLSRVADVQQAIPFLILAIAVAVILGPSLANVVIVLAVTTWVSYFRVVRSETLSVRESPLVDAARVIGARDTRILLRHVLPNVSASIIVIASLMVANMIIFEASLSFLGLGVPPPTPTWGRMVFEGIQYVESAWWMSVFPGLAIVLTVLGINLFGDWLRDVLDPRLQVR